MTAQIVSRRVRYLADEKLPGAPMQKVRCTAFVEISFDVDSIAVLLAMRCHKTRNKKTTLFKGLIKAELSQLVRER